ncbi:uncharacterized protein VTP21DRAFT_2613 [Calcarisporiella thermophila]|uniref:uncharacterized protein n=1 Tax=Calcarisporiella thermophila TaxID=911321 RepID=UPI0037431728
MLPIEEVKEAKRRRLVVLSFWAVIILGIPLWWKTTEVYRAPLPFAEIEEWSHKTCDMRFPVHLRLHISDATKDLDITGIGNSVKDGVAERLKSEEKCLEYEADVSVMAWNDAKQSESSTWLDEEDQDSEPGTYDLYVRPDVPVSRSKKFIDANRVFVGRGRRMLVLVKDWREDEISKVLSIYASSLFTKERESIRRIIAEQRGEQTAANHDSMRTFKYSREYRITFSLMNGGAGHVDWDIAKAVDVYLQPFLRELSVVSNFTVDSQIQHYASLTVTPQHHQDGTSSYYYLTPEKLPHFVNAAEWNLASIVSSYPTINFVLYVASPEMRPLKIHDARGNIIESNAFSIPQWGGVVIANPASSSKQENGYHFSPSELATPMSVFLTQLRDLMGVRDISAEISDALGPSFMVDFAPAREKGLTALELDALLRRRQAENLSSALTTLRSLAQLVQNIPNMVVLSQIQAQVDEALRSVRAAFDGRKRLVDTVRDSIVAVSTSEGAFFDPTMVAMLYFPDEHKYAIYMPLFVPISVPLLGALRRELSERRKRKKSKEKGKEKDKKDQ